MTRAMSAFGIALVATMSVATMSVAPARAQDTSVRFDVASVGDSTVTFRLGRTGWVRPGQLASAVDPRRRDALVARLRVLLVTRDSAVAVIVGQTAPIIPEHVVVMDRPATRWWTRAPFWLGLVGGLVTGFAVGKA